MYKLFHMAYQLKLDLAQPKWMTLFHYQLQPPLDMFNTPRYFPILYFYGKESNFIILIFLIALEEDGCS